MEKLNETYSVLIPDGERTILSAILNCASQINNIKLYVMSTIKDNSLRYSRYVHRFFYFPEISNELEWISNINKVTREHDIDLIMPLWETAIHTDSQK